MRFGLVHRIMTDLLAALGVIALVSSGELGRATSILILVSLAIALAIPETWQQTTPMQRIATFAPLTALAVQLARLAWGAPVLQTAVEFAIALQIIRLATRRGAAQDQQVIVLAWLHLIAGTVLGGGLGYALCLIGFLTIAPGALVLSHLRREVEGNYRQGARDRTGLPVDVPRILRSRRVVGKTFLALTCLLALPILAFTAVTFVLFPRVGLSLILLNRPTTGRLIGFSDHVELGGMGTLRNDPTIVLRVEVPQVEPTNPPSRLTMYLRGTALDTYDGKGWHRTRMKPVPAEHEGNLISIERYPSPATDKSIRLDLEPIEPSVIFLPPRTVGLRVRPRGEPLFGGALQIERGGEDEYLYSGPDQRGIVYEAYLAEPNEVIRPRLTDKDRARYLTIPHIPSRIPQLAQEWTASAKGAAEKAKAIEHHLRTAYTYDLGSPSGGAADPLDDFLFASRRGHCEYFSTAMAVMLRTLGIPSRNVTGFIGGTYNRFGKYYSVRQGDAHSWVEAYVEGGWTRFDPTPSTGAQPLAESTGWIATLRDVLEAIGRTWDHKVVRYDLQQQLWLFGRARSQIQWMGTSFRGVPTGSGMSARMLVLIGATTASALLVAYAVYRWVRRYRPAKTKPNPDAPSRQEKEATALYAQLDAAMTAIGIGRAPGIPPLKHALTLETIGHPVSAEVMLLTNRYLEARFGHHPILAGERRELEQRVAHVRAFRPKPAAVVSLGRPSLRTRPREDRRT